jgi:mRNA-degrading endonuclease RelE of RelBE toxin-antitoxin system
MFGIRFSAGVEPELAALRAYDQAAVLDAIEEQLSYQPEVPTRRRKKLEDFTAPEEWAAQPPVWQLQVGAFRVFYDVDPERSLVWVRAVKRKPSHKTTGEIL